MKSFLLSAVVAAGVLGFATSADAQFRHGGAFVAPSYNSSPRYNYPSYNRYSPPYYTTPPHYTTPPYYTTQPFTSGMRSLYVSPYRSGFYVGSYGAYTSPFIGGYSSGYAGISSNFYGGSGYYYGGYRNGSWGW